MSAANRELTEPEMTLFIRQAIYRSDLYGRLAQIPGGRAVLLAQRRKGLSILSEGVAIWGDENIAWAKWALKRIGECLAMIETCENRKRIRTQASKLREMREAQSSIRTVSELGLILMHQHAFGDEVARHKSPDADDFREVWLGLRRIFTRAGGKVAKEPKL